MRETLKDILQKLEESMSSTVERQLAELTRRAGTTTPTNFIDKWRVDEEKIS